MDGVVNPNQTKKCRIVDSGGFLLERTTNDTDDLGSDEGGGLIVHPSWSSFHQNIYPPIKEIRARTSMSFLQLLVLALVQGITEFLPISSSAHLVVAPMLVDSWQDQGPVIDVAAHVGSLFAVLLYFRADTMRLVQGGFDTLRFRQSEDRELFLFLALASLPFLTIGMIVALTGIIDHLRSAFVIGLASIIFGAWLWHADRRPSDISENTPRVDTLTLRHAMLVGCAQIFAIIPGASRSGVTMTASRYLGWSRAEGAKLSMLLAIPTIAALGLLAGLDLITGQVSDAEPLAALIVAVLSFISAYAAIFWMMGYIQRASFTPFVIYRIIFGVALLILAAGPLGA